MSTKARGRSSQHSSGSLSSTAIVRLYCELLLPFLPLTLRSHLLTQNFCKHCLRRLFLETYGILFLFLDKIDPELVLPTVRSNIESYISWIAKGKAHLTSVVKHAIGQFYAKFIYFKEHVYN